MDAGMRIIIVATLATLWLVVMVSEARAGVAVGIEFQVTDYTLLEQSSPRAAMATDGDFVVVWGSQSQDGSRFGVFARRFSSHGVALAVEFQVNSHTENAQGLATVAMNGDGDFLVVWESIPQAATSGELFGRRFGSAGAAIGLEFQINSHTLHIQRAASAALNDDGSFVVTWTSFRGGSEYGVVANRFSSTGARLGAEFQVESYTTLGQRLSTIAMDAAGGFVIAWGSFGQDGSSSGVFAQRFSRNGDRNGGEFQVNTYTEGSQYFAGVAMTPDGAFVIVWHSPQDGSDTGIFARRFASSGASIGGEFQVNLETTMGQSEPQIAMSDAGDFVVVWHTLRDGSDLGVFGRRFIRTGAGLGNEFQINTRTALHQFEPSPAMAGDGGFVVTWTSVMQDGPEVDNFGVFAQRFHAPILDVDGEGAATAPTDGLLILRHVFGFTGITLVSGAVDLADCTRCTDAEVESYLTVIDPLLDIDGDGQVEPLTDGLLVLRWLFGFTGTNLTAGAVDLANCTRCTGQELESHLASLGP
jgi:hypothetical protein